MCIPVELVQVQDVNRCAAVMMSARIARALIVFFICVFLVIKEKVYSAVAVFCCAVVMP